MNSHLRSVSFSRDVAILTSVLWLAFFVVGFGTSLAMANDEVSLKGDQQTVEELRKSIPPDVRAENDSLKEILSLLGEVKDPPNRHRERFDRLMRKIREDKRKEHKKERDSFSKNERKAREKFLKEQKSDREKFVRKKAPRDEQKEFYANQDARRKEFFDQERDSRKEFESERRQIESDFNAYHKEKLEEFRQELRSYTERYNDFKKSKAK